MPISEPRECPYCHSNDLAHRPVHGATLTTCVECEANALDGQWASGRAVRRMRRAIADADANRYEQA